VPKYKIRFFFDAGSGICLWAADDATRQIFDYPIDIWNLALPENTKRQTAYLITWFDTSIDWNDPAGLSKWDTEETKRFNTATQRLLVELRKELGDQFEIVDESGTLS
jgi:hypothetical protein